MSAEPERMPLPKWLLWAGSAAIIFHLVALLVVVLAVPSGPWPTRMGSSTALAPRFAQDISNFTTTYYIQPLQMSCNYHFESDRTDYDVVFFEAQLRDGRGNLIQTIRFPQEKANFWVWNRQILLGQRITFDELVQPPQGEAIPAPGQKPRMTTIWGDPENGVQKLEEIPELRTPRDQPVFRPSNLSLVLARSYARYLAREFGAQSVELIRHHKAPIYPAAMFGEEPPPETFEEIVSSFGVYPSEK